MCESGSTICQVGLLDTTGVMHLKHLYKVEFTMCLETDILDRLQIIHVASES